MRAVWSWILELCEPERALTAEEGAAALTRLGIEVEGIEPLGEAFSGVVVAEVVARRPHPGADRLTLVDVIDAAGGAATQVVCGAPNVPEPGGKVLWARPGAVLPGGFEIGVRPIKGVESPGMLCSEKELGLGDDGSGILILAGDAARAAPGTVAQEALALTDSAFELSIPANRGDVLGHLGLARELCAAVGGKLRPPPTGLEELSDRSLDAGALVSVAIDDPDGCARYVARIIDGVTVARSPLWMRQRLAAVGVRPLSNLVDVTNYVLFELGQPLHAFDFAKLDGGITVRRARPGEPIVTLDDVERRLEPSDLAICDRRGPVAIAGVMGGATTEVDDSTSRVLLESASFLPVSVRRTARRLGLHSESSHRFERGVDPNGAERASARAARLICELAGGRVASGSVDAYVRRREPRRISMRMARARALTGVEISQEEAASSLTRLGLEVAAQQHEGEAAETLAVTCPTFRPDLEREVDVIEEVLRVYGFDKVPATLPTGAVAPAGTRDLRPVLARRALAATGMSEVITFGFTSRERIAALRLPEEDPRRARVAALRNPMSSEQAVMRTSLLPNLLAALSRNLKYGLEDVRLFEVGSVFWARDGETLPEEPMRVAGVLAGRRPGWLAPGEPLDFFDAKGVVEALVAAVVGDGEGVAFAAAPDVPYLHPGMSAAISLPGGATVGTVGEIHPVVREAFEIEPACLGFEVALDAVPQPPLRTLRAIPRHPAVTRDLSFFVDAAVPAAQVRRLIAEEKTSLIERVAVLEDYRDPAVVPEGQKGMLWSITYRAPDRTLTDAEVDAAHEALVARLLGELPAQRR